MVFDDSQPYLSSEKPVANACIAFPVDNIGTLVLMVNKAAIGKSMINNI